MRLNFEGRGVLVTGAAQGLGRAIAAAALEAGATLTLADIDEAGVCAAAKTLGAEAIVVDLGERAAVLAALGDLAPDIVIHAAGGTRGQAHRPLGEIDEASWRRVFAANVDAFAWVAQASAPAMVAKGRGRLVALASGAGLRPSLTGVQAYTAAKHALVGLVKQLSQEFGPHGVTVNAVAPGFVRSNPTTEAQWHAMGETGQARLIEATHVRRLGTPADIAAACLFLASDEAGYISGQTLCVDGGRS
ncbi:MAG: SDR family NAD(P)-dependent oxidoreductase [Pseudomonadota bacterium]